MSKYLSNIRRPNRRAEAKREIKKRKRRSSYLETVNLIWIRRRVKTNESPMQRNMPKNK